jgi:prepilin-type N-terminal cleavage/methylation domain-containing protein
MNAILTRRASFTLVELLIVIVIVAILAAVSVVAYNGIQQRA